MNITAKITGIKYTPFLCRDLNEYGFDELDNSLSKDATFILKVDDKNKVAISWWVSAKRTRSYPYARVYDSLSFSGKKITIIPILKDEGKEGDRDFLQWDTVSLMSLLGIYVIISYYKDAIQSSRYKHKITKQKFDIEQVKSEIKKIISFQSDALHWNLKQIENVGEIGEKALKSYEEISSRLGVEMHSKESAKKRIQKLLEGKEEFMNLSRKLAKKAQEREQVTTQPKELVDGTKATLTIKNYLGGYYYFTADEVEIKGEDVHLIEAKHTGREIFPSPGDIKDGLLRMILFTNLEEVKVDDKEYNPVPVLKLTSDERFDIDKLSSSKREILETLMKEAKTNGFKVLLNNNSINFPETQTRL